MTTMEEISLAIVTERRAAMARGEKPPFNDMLSLMVEAKDPESGLGLSDDEIVAHINTFLIAGHETTSGLLSFAFYLIQTNPTVEAKALGNSFLFYISYSCTCSCRHERTNAHQPQLKPGSSRTHCGTHAGCT